MSMEVAPDKRPVAKRAADPKAYGRSRVSNGSTLLPGIDGRSPWVRRCRDIIAAHLSDLGGKDNTSAAERSIIRRIAVLTTELEMLEKNFATSGQADPDALDLYVRASGNLRRLLEAIGLQRRAKEVTLIDLIVEDQERQRQKKAAEYDKMREAGDAAR
jgi:hypothetical protein